MVKKEYNFNKKIECIYIHLCSRDLETLAKLFWIEKRGSLNHRMIHIRSHWLKSSKENYLPRLFKNEFKTYEISKLTLDGKALFKNANEFLELDINEFCKRVKEYSESFLEDENIFKEFYPYLYFHNKRALSKDYNIDYYTIKYEERISSNSIAISVLAPEYKQKLFNVPKYNGKIFFIRNKIVILFENHYDYIAAIFNTALGNKNNNYLVGVAIGIADSNQQTPIAKKAILSKITLEKLSTIYPILNESETIVADETIYHNQLLESNIDYFFNKYMGKLKDLESFFKNISKKHLHSLYYQLALNDFYELNNTLELVRNNASYTIKERVRILKELIKSYSYKKYNKLFMVMPILGKYYIFNHISQDAIDIKNGLIELSKRVDIEIIFIVDNCNHKFTVEFEIFLKEIKEHVKVYFANRELLENSVNSLDFLFTDNKDFVIVKLLRATIQLFRFFNDSISVKEYEALFNKIKNRSIGFNDYFSHKREKICKSNKKLNEKIFNQWYIYFYVNALEEYILKIYPNSKVELLENDGSLHSIGKIINYSYESIIILEKLEDGKSTTIVFDNYIYDIKDMFQFKIIGKDAKVYKDIITIGVASKEPLKEEEVKNILGSKEKAMLNSSELIKERLNRFLREK